MRFAESPRKRHQAEPSHIERRWSEILPESGGTGEPARSPRLRRIVIAETQADREFGRTLRSGGIAVNRPSLWRTSRQPSSWTIR